MTAVVALVLPSYRGDSRAVFVVGPAGWPYHDQQEAEKLLRQVGDLSELNVKLRCQKLKEM